jgi:hypothetical protein
LQDPTPPPFITLHAEVLAIHPHSPYDVYRGTVVGVRSGSYEVRFFDPALGTHWIPDTDVMVINNNNNNNNTSSFLPPHSHYYIAYDISLEIRDSERVIIRHVTPFTQLNLFPTARTQQLSNFTLTFILL